jgi:hypothetical protein
MKVTVVVRSVPERPSDVAREWHASGTAGGDECGLDLPGSGTNSTARRGRPSATTCLGQERIGPLLSEGNTLSSP